MTTLPDDICSYIGRLSHESSRAYAEMGGTVQSGRSDFALTILPFYVPMRVTC